MNKHFYCDEEKFRNTFYGIPLNECILRLAQPCESFMEKACRMACFDAQQLLNLLSETERKAIQYRFKHVKDLIQHHREAYEEKMMELTGNKAPCETLDEKEEYLASNYIFEGI